MAVIVVLIVVLGAKMKVRLVVVIALVLVLSFIVVRMPYMRWSETHQIPNTIDERVLEAHVRVLSEELIPRTCEQPLELQKAAAYVRDEFLRWNAEVTAQTYTIGSNTFSNIISSYGPDAGSTIIVGAHYDAYAQLPGADDNASGVAGLLELGRALSKINLPSKIILVAYACEEPPYFAGSGMGSYVHANSLRGTDIALMISLEMIGYFSDEPRSQQFPLPVLSFVYPTTGDYVAVVGELLTSHAAKLKGTINSYTNISAYSINAPKTLPGVDFSDHRNFRAMDIPAVMVTDTAFYRNPYYHTANDTFDTLNYEKMKEIVHGVFVYILHASDRR